MRRVLFVDGDASVLDGMRRVLHKLRNEWEMHFVDGAVVALEMLDSAGPFDVIVSDMSMPGMNGADLLEVVRDRHPGVVRIILSGRTDADLALRMATCAHQFLTKPCDSDVLKAVVTRSIALHQRLRDERLKEFVGGMRTLPALPRTYLDLSAAMACEQVTIAEVASIVERDSAIAVKILQLVNSSFFGLQREVNTLRDAVSFLGLTTIKSLVLQYGVLEEFRPDQAAPSFDIQEHQRHSLDVAHLAREILSDDKRLSERASWRASCTTSDTWCSRPASRRSTSASVAWAASAPFPCRSWSVARSESATRKWERICLGCGGCRTRSSRSRCTTTAPRSCRR
jgi:CheY-like chemotaxis protein